VDVLEDERFKWYQATVFGDIVSEGPTPIPEGVITPSTEIHWFDHDPSLDKPIGTNAETASP
jgi:hypothetical protein